MKSVQIKFYFFIIAALLNGSSLFSQTNVRAKKEVISVEAETGSLLNGATMQKEVSASQGNYVHIGASGIVRWHINIPKNGYYSIKIRYRAPEGEKETYLLKNGVKIPVGFARSTVWNNFEQLFYLQKGSNELGLEKSWPNIDIDNIAIAPVNPMPEITPRNILAYQIAPRDIVLKVDNYGEKISAVRCNGKIIAFTSTQYPHQEQASYVTLAGKSLKNMPVGTHSLQWTIGNRQYTSRLEIKHAPESAPLEIILPYVEHGSGVIVKCPDNKYLMIDDGKDWVRDSILIPLLRKLDIDTIHTFILTHYDHDHDAGDSARKLRNMFHVQRFIDYDSVHTGQHWTEHGLNLTVLNSAENGHDENTKSLSFLMEYKGFRYLHSADNYAINQDAIMTKGVNIKADVFYGNHHFHGSTDPIFIEKVAPRVIVFQSQEAIYARSAYMTDVKKRAIPQLRKQGISVDLLPTLEVGTVIFRVKDKDHWSYETAK